MTGGAAVGSRAWSRGQSALPIAILGFSVLIVVAGWLGVAWQVATERERAVATAKADIEAHTRAFAEHTERVLAAADQFTGTLKVLHESNQYDHDVVGMLRSATVLGDFVIQANVIDRDGRLTVRTAPGVATSIDLSDREHFRVHVERDTGAVFISAPINGRATGRRSVQLTRRLNRPDGGFDGVVTVSIDPERIAVFAELLPIGSGGNAALFGMDGVMRARHPFDPRSTEFRLPQTDELMQRVTAQPYGIYMRSSRLDHVERLYGFRRLGHYPLFVVIGRAMNEVMEEPMRRQRTYIAAALVMSVVVLSMATVLAWQARRQAADRQNLVEAKFKAEEASRAKSSFLAAISHEIRTPLNAILGFSEMMSLGLVGPINQRQKNYLNDVMASGRLLHGLLSDVLDLARLESGKLDLADDIVDVGGLADEVIRMFEPQAVASGLRVVSGLAATPWRVRADQRRFQQMLVNLVSNAIKFTPRGGQVTITAARAATGGLDVVVVDSGIGIAPEAARRLFEPFVQANAHVARESAGAGLGLALTRGLIEAHGGTISLASEPGHGTAVSLHFPAERVIGATAAIEDDGPARAIARGSDRGAA